MMKADLCFFLALSLTLAHLLSSPVNAAEEVQSEFSLSDDKNLPEAGELFETGPHSLSKRRLKPLKYPNDCVTKKLTKFAEKCGLTVTAGGSHWKVYDGNHLLTTIPHTVKKNQTCKSIITTLNGRCA